METPASLRLVGLALSLTLCATAPAQAPSTSTPAPPALALNDSGYFATPGLDVMLADDFYPEGHQGGVSVIQNGRRVATNGDLRLEPTPGQWSPIPRLVERTVDAATGTISAHFAYPDAKRDRTGFNPILYPDLAFDYTVRIAPAPTESTAGAPAFRITVDLHAPLPEDWVGRVGFNWEFFPGYLFGAVYDLDGQTGLFPRQANGPTALNPQPTNLDKVIGDRVLPLPLASGRRLTVAPDRPDQRLSIRAVRGDDLALYDGRSQHTNGWFIVRATLPGGVTAGALEWIVSAATLPDWQRDPAVQVSQVGYHPAQPKFAVVELDRRAPLAASVRLEHIHPDGTVTTALTQPATAARWDGDFLRYTYLKFDFSTVTTPGLYRVRYGDDATSVTFRIDPDLYTRDVWQPTLETFLPVQMCHVRVNDRYRVWHDFCHLDDALMAPTDFNHFDGYTQGPSTLTAFNPGDFVPGLDRGGWHDAGDHDLRIESQIHTVYGLALAWEHFGIRYDNTAIDQARRIVELQEPDGQPDLLQQIEHGLISIVPAYESLGRLYRGIITPSHRQYVLLGDPTAGTDNVSGGTDDNWVFTEDNPRREIDTAAGLAAGARALRHFNPELADRALTIAIALWDHTTGDQPAHRITAAVELLLATEDERYATWLRTHADAIAESFERTGWAVGRTLPLIDDAAYHETLNTAARANATTVAAQAAETPYGIPYRPAIWGAGWNIQSFGRRAYYLHRTWPDLYPADYYLNALNFVLGCHPGDNPLSFVSGVGANSVEVAYGINRADESYIPGGIASGTALIRPDFPELLRWPYLWQQTEYVLGYGTTDFLTLALAAQHELSLADSP
ncbi:glycoside hydrolase family 9 protein [Actomonas aquatica]|uniref:Glycoside hydrolase family 9 protein n=1 Tax=Actomonas aquatica TaxID=2866162 RepID=A0ABZ1C2Z4_9BACT|nr:glycoside hydrolase family 9 protein [Opitutus sp. WL0086]WRQ86069.1 glycoside hydrolase family 9 protein [Opitutus sp. WL0086]